MKLENSIILILIIVIILVTGFILLMNVGNFSLTHHDNANVTNSHANTSHQKNVTPEHL